MGKSLKYLENLENLVLYDCRNIIYDELKCLRNIKYISIHSRDITLLNSVQYFSSMNIKANLCDICINGRGRRCDSDSYEFD